MTIRKTLILTAAALGLPMTTHAWFHQYPKPAGKYAPAKALTAADSAAWNAKLTTAWTAWKTTFVNKYGCSKVLPLGTYPTTEACVYDVSGATPGGGHVSEGMGYGMLMSVLFNDQAMFDRMFKAAEEHYWVYDKATDLGWYAWKTNSCNQRADQYCRNGAPDADEDILLALVFAATLVEKGYWKDNSITALHRASDTTVAKKSVTMTYKEKASNLEASFVAAMITSGNDVTKGLSPDALKAWNWNYPPQQSGKDVHLVNPCYFSPAWYRVFRDYFASGAADWNAVATNGYVNIKGQPGYKYGLVRDWSLQDGSTQTVMSGTDFKNKDNMWFDGVRTPWRIAMDAQWYGDAEANAYIDNVWTGGVVDAAAPGMYGDGPSIGGTYRVDALSNNPRNILTTGYKKIGPRGMWGAAAAVAAAKYPNQARILNDSAFADKLMVSTQYYDETLALLGDLVISGNFPNIYDDLIGSTPITLVAPLKTPVSTVLLSSNAQITATLSRSAEWTLTFKGLTSGASYIASGKGTSVMVFWAPKAAGTVGTFVANEKVAAVLTAKGQTFTSGNTLELTTKPGVGLHRSGLAKPVQALWKAGSLVLTDLPKTEQAFDVEIQSMDGRLVRRESLRGASGLRLAVPEAAPGLCRVRVSVQGEELLSTVLPVVR